MDRKIYKMERPMERFSPMANAEAKGELRRFEREITAMPGCLVDIPGSLRTDPNNGGQGFWLWASVKLR